MKLQQFILNLALLFSAGKLFCQSNQTERLFIPLMDKESQSNVNVAVSDFGGPGKPCRPEYTNVLSNTNLFSLEDQQIIKEVFVKYQNVTTNSGPPGTVLAGLYRTNYTIKVMNETANVENWVANFQFTNSEAHEQIKFGSGMSAEFRNKSNDGYNASITRTGGGTTLLNFGEIKHGLPNGLFARFTDLHEQGPNWDYKLASFTNSQLVEYRQRTNGLVTGKFLMWNALNGNVIVEAEFKEPYEFEKHRTDLRMLQHHP